MRGFVPALPQTDAACHIQVVKGFNG